MLLLGWNSDRTGERRWHFAIPQLTSAVALSCLVLFAAIKRHSGGIAFVRYIWTVAYLPAFWALPSSFLSASRLPRQLGSSIAWRASVDFLVPRFSASFSQRTGSFHSGFIIMIACWVLASVLVMLCPRDRAR
jgi:hypothetical protein